MQNSETGSRLRLGMRTELAKPQAALGSYVSPQRNPHKPSPNPPSNPKSQIPPAPRALVGGRAKVYNQRLPVLNRTKGQTAMRSDIKLGDASPHRSLRATGLNDDDFKPFIGICNNYTDIIRAMSTDKVENSSSSVGGRRAFRVQHDRRRRRDRDGSCGHEVFAAQPRLSPTPWRQSSTPIASTR